MKKGSLLKIAGLVLALGGCTLVVAEGGNSPILTDRTAKELEKKAGKRPVIVFTVAQDGEVTALRMPEQAKQKPFELPDLPNFERVFGWQTIGVVVSNPKVCWTTGGGDRRCVRY